MTYVKMTISPADIEWAVEKTRILAEGLKDTDLKSRFNTDWESNNICGYLGEAIVAQWLKFHNIEYEWEHDTVGESDRFDFLIQNKKWDVKTNMRHLPVSTITDTYQLGVLDAQLDNGHADYYLWVLIEGEDPRTATTAYIIGSKSNEALKAGTLREKTQGAPYRCIEIGEATTPRHTVEYTMRGF